MVENCLLCACFLCYILDVVRKGTNAWRFLANLTSPVSDGCLAAVEGRLWLVGGQQGVGVTSIVLGGYYPGVTTGQHPGPSLAPLEGGRGRGACRLHPRLQGPQAG